MAISDINKAMAYYAQPSTYDQNAWKTAFDISNAFAETSEKHRQNRENLATSDWRVAYQNNNFETGIGKNNISLADLRRVYNNALQTDPSQVASTIANNNYNTTNHNLNTQKLQGEDQRIQIEAKYRYDPLGRMRTDEEVYNLAVQNGDLTSNYAKANSQQALQKYYTDTASVIAPFNPQTAGNFGYQAGLPYMVDNQNNLVLGSTGEVIAKNLSPEQIASLYPRPLSQKEKELALRQQYTLESIAARQQGALEKQQSWESIQQDKDLTSAFKNVYSGAQKTDEYGNKTGVLDPTLFRQQIQQLYLIYPSQINAINEFVTRTVTQNGWK
ncbi:hypothetical protein ACWIVU_01040 [Ursidibacter arcticus]